MNIFESLKVIQRDLKAPKNQRNTFGKYNYRSAEDILEAVKPLCHANNTALTVSDEMILLGERYYIKATATLHDFSGNKIEVSAFAREPLDQKGMNAAQITGSASSYARKYALNGLFNIDDTKDADFTNKHGKEDKPKKTTPKKVNEESIANALISEYQKDQIQRLIKSGHVDSDGMKVYYKVKSTDELNFQQANAVITQGNKNKVSA